MKILGIDPGTTIIGYGVVETGAKGLLCLDYGVFRVQTGTETSNRITSVYDFFEKLIKKHQPDKAGIEKLFFFKNNPSQRNKRCHTLGFAKTWSGSKRIHAFASQAGCF